MVVSLLVTELLRLRYAIDMRIAPHRGTCSGQCARTREACDAARGQLRKCQKCKIVQVNLLSTCLCCAYYDLEDPRRRFALTYKVSLKEFSALTF